MALRVTQSTSAGGLVEYFDAELARGDYYTERGNLPGQWRGKGAEILGLSGGITREEFAALAHNIHPETDEQITAAMRENRRPGYDFTYSVPKSVSVLYEHLMASGQNGEGLRILEAFKESVRDSMNEVENAMQTRIRAGGQNADKVTGNMVWAEFTHFQARPVDGIADPHLHIHAYAFNMTHDGENWKAGQFGQLKKDAEYYSAFADDRFATRLQDMGYATTRDGLSFELKGVNEATRGKFSERTRQIEAKAQKEGITSAVEKAKIGARTRRNKETGLSPEENRERSHARLDAVERRTLDSLKDAHPIETRSDGEAFQYTEDYWFERKSVVSEKRYLAEALKAGVGSGLSWRVHEAIKHVKGLVRGTDDTGARVVTTEAIQAEERAILSHVRNGRGSAESFASIGKGRGQTGYTVKDDRLTGEQRQVVAHVLGNINSVMGIMGGAGTGKTTAMGEVVRAIHATSGQNVVVLAPTTPARDVLRKDGFQAETVAKLLVDKDLQKKTRGGVIYVDEAGLLGTEDMRAVFALAKTHGARVILQGDTKQHQSVKRGDALRLLEKQGGVAFASIAQIRRQENAGYRSAVESLVKGDTAEGFAKLESMGAVREVTKDSVRYQGIAESYAAKLAKGHTAIVVAPTHAEIAKVTDAVRANLKASGQLGKDRAAPAFHLVAKGWTEAERGSAHGYEVGQVVEFRLNAEGFRKGERATVWSTENGAVTVVRHGKNAARVTLDLKNATAFEVYERREFALSVGELVRVTQGAKDADGKCLERGSVYEVRGFGADGSLMLAAPGNAPTRRVDAGEALHLAHGYATTSHASQSRTSHHVIAAMGSESFAATSWEQFYVTLSRGKWSAELWTDDREALQEEVTRSGRRSFALDVRQENPREATPAQEEPARHSRLARAAEVARNILQRRRRVLATEERQATREQQPEAQPLGKFQQREAERRERERGRTR